MNKQEIRQLVWKTLEEKNIASFPRPVYGRIPNFKGSEKAAKILTETKEFKQASIIKINPDSPQRKVREIALREGKKILTPTPRLRGQFFLLDGKRISDPRKASSISGFTSEGEKIDFDKIPKIDMIIVGSVAVTRTGDRVGKGEGYSELEYAILREQGKIDENTPVATTVHSIQIVDKIPTEIFDVPVDIIATEKELIITQNKREKPKGLYLDYLSKEKIEDTPYLKYYLKVTKRI
ncbi:5-formyltetrahydrofolate cyclo-ligase [Acidianus manzaensis]|uniref:5-formyltetrahydrofolate cyclo-ligase n=1 Tax=Acidianus manzaensis TaxID=282676 RepID=A0A1W6K2J4_9CREN|nr:5-formyltetrahydrofolate cyclo-ligase [Acidianus manzaensis]ARM76682.1 5-formyltetrahydrofolate cyclo-ligase [Acidianus manzaensis]